MKRRTAREKALQSLFQVDLSKIEPQQAIRNVLGDKSGDLFLEKLVLGTTENLAAIDEVISKNLEKWTIERLGNIDRTILRLATYEMLYLEDIPYNVSIDEAIELAKKFGDQNSSKFINSVLSKIKQNIETKLGGTTNDSKNN
ncbi:transcription antitermination factor NusB [Calidifontibacillus erzurumensis]|uniref:Transcription antitermination protein NusB n=1 Tax=Calidifontibacillus erzurumensis TaxID=2741433 RepID=A0A8J8GDE4_9BACI|nr:transcription antitermination factor NusB [Calidifontibacillus erzurumensis]NSL50388.1 transcription antitermination factor NusB [Calidifontibacillus erzurumensis]